jgi:heme exporter protein B
MMRRWRRAPEPGEIMSSSRALVLICGKDLRQELRTRENLTAVLFFALLVQLVFSFAFDFQDLGLGFEDVGAGVIWVTLTFSAILSLQNSFLMERERDCLQALTLCPNDPSAIFLGKLLANTLFVLAVQALILPISALFFSYDLTAAALPIAMVVLVNTVGFSALGTLFSAMTARSRRSELLLPLLLFPAATPLVIWGVKATRLCLAGRHAGTYGYLVALSACFDAIFIVAGILLFDYVVEE